MALDFSTWPRSILSTSNQPVMHLGLPFLSLAITMGAHACDPSSALDEANAKPSQWMGNRTQKIVWAKDLPSSSLTYLLCFLMFLFAHSTSQRGFILGIVFTLVYKFTCSIHFEANPSIATVSNMCKWLQTRELWIAMLDDCRVETHVNSTQMVIDVCKLVGPSKICPLKGRCTHTHTPITMLQAPVASLQAKHQRPSELVLSHLWTKRAVNQVFYLNTSVWSIGAWWISPCRANLGINHQGNSATTWGKKTSRKLERFALANPEFPSEIQWISKHFHPGLASHGNR